MVVISITDTGCGFGLAPSHKFRPALKSKSVIFPHDACDLRTILSAEYFFHPPRKVLLRITAFHKWRSLIGHVKEKLQLIFHGLDITGIHHPKPAGTCFERLHHFLANE